MSEISAFGVIHKSLVSKKVWPVGTKHRYLWNTKKVAPKFGGTKVPKPGKTPPNPASRNSQKKAARHAALGRNDTVQASGAVEQRPWIQSARQGAKTGKVLANSSPQWKGKDPSLVARKKAETLKLGDRIGGNNSGTMRGAGTNMRVIRAKRRIDPRGIGI